MSAPPPTQNQDRLRSHFSSLDASSHPSGWDSLWRDGSFIPWDRGYANPALIDFLANPSSPPLSETPNPTPGAPDVGRIDWEETRELPNADKGAKRKRALVPGCGKGYDVALLATYGYDTWGLEVSPHAVEVAKKYLADPGEGPLEGEYKIKDAGVGRGKMECVLGDFFEDEWIDKEEGEGGFDLIYDNTFLCALPPSLRPRWALRMSQLLSSTGILVCLEFPTHKPASSGGPPWSLPPTVHLELLKRPGEDIKYDDNGIVVATQREEAGNALVRVAHWTPKRTHDVAVIKGVVRDCVSVWRHQRPS